MRDRASVRHVLELLETSGYADFFYRPVGTADQLFTDLGAWATQARYREFDVAFIATHGEPGIVDIAGQRVAIDQRALDEAKRARLRNLDQRVLAEELKGSLARRFVYFGACSVAYERSGAQRRKGFRSSLEEFRRMSNATIACGYTEDVDFMTSAAFEVLLLRTLAFYKRRAYAIDYLMTGEAKSLAKELGFVTTPP